MKTPRELLLGRHDAMRPSLDQIRQDIVGRIGARRTSIAAKLWHELILPVRRAWICIGAAWVVVLALNLIAGGHATVAAIIPAHMNPDSLIALQRQERLMAQLNDDDNTASPPAKTPERRPRSEAPVKSKIV